MKIQLRNRTFVVEEGQYDEVWKYINSGKWESQTCKILDYFVGREDIVIDLGAWIGAVSLYAEQLASKVYAVEPDPVVFPFLEKNVLQNPELKSKIRCCKLAISKQNGLFTLYARKQYGVSSSSSLPRIRDGLSTEQVRGITLREFIDSEKIKKIDFIKMDIEGGEFDLLPSIIDELKNLNFPSLYISFHYNYLTEHQYLQKVKFKLLSRLLMKLESWARIELFRKTKERIILNSLQSLKDYEFVYTETGQEISPAWFQSNPSLIKNYNLVFTNKKWIQDEGR
jgi:FkbM family methyltransferase